MNYIDEGEGHAVVFVHGCMTWSFLFRRTVEALSATYRCIVPDHLGFGLSEKPQTAGYLPDDHVRRFEKFMAVSMRVTQWRQLNSTPYFDSR